MSDKTVAEEGFRLTPADTASLRRHARARIEIEADRLMHAKQEDQSEYREALGRLAAMGKLLTAIGWDSAHHDRALDEELFPVGQLQAWVEHHFLPDDRETLRDVEGDPELDLVAAAQRLGETLSLLLRLRERVARRHAGLGDIQVEDEANRQLGETALEALRLANRLTTLLVGGSPDLSVDETAAAATRRVDARGSIESNENTADETYLPYVLDGICDRGEA